MKSHNLKIFEYTFLILGMTTFIMLFYIFRHNKGAEILIIGICSACYSIWGLIHHKIEDRLNISVALEYIFVSILVFLIAFVALNVY